MKKIIFASVALALVSFSSLAEKVKESKVVVEKSEEKEMCRYGKSLYTEGSLLKMGDEVRVCKYSNSTFLKEGVRLQWVSK